jgi:subtilisin family serine protease
MNQAKQGECKMKLRTQLLMAGLILFLAIQAFAQVSLKNKPKVIPNELVIKFKTGVVLTDVLDSLSEAGIVNVSAAPRLSCVKGTVEPGRDFDQVVAQCRGQANVEYVEPNYRLYALETPPVFPNDPEFNQLYGLHQSNDNDIDAPEAWELTTGSANIIVGVIDTGIDYDHEDLKANIWINPGESGGGKENNNLDDDGNGYKDDYRGWNFIYKSNDPYDDNDHGTHCAGTVGAVGNNGRGVVGVNWNVKLMALKFLGSDGSGGTAEAAEAIVYAVDNGAKVLSNSWGGGESSQVLKDAIQYAHDRGVLFIAASGNDSKNTDTSANYPSNYEVPNVVSVASNDNADAVSSFSNYGRRTVDLSAPGSSVYSTRPLNRYQRLSGTSMATPHVAGAAALVMSRFPGITSDRVIVRLLGGVDRKSQFIGKMVSGGRLNVRNAMSTNPLIALTTDWSNTTNTAGPYPVSTKAVDDQSIARVRLIYQLNGASSDTLNMAPGATDTYSANIPGQPMNTTINYMVLATDNAGNRTLGPTYSFKISSEPDPGEGDGCCGSAAMAFEGVQGPVKYAVELPLNLAFFLLPLALLRKRRKK